MRVLIANQHLRRVAGIETYLATVIPELTRAGCAVAMLGEADVPANAARIAPPGVPWWCITEMGRGRAVAAMREWRPDVIFANGQLDPATTSALQATAPAVFYAHGYYGTCISGAKSFKFPVARPCRRRFGAMCLLHYLPHRCGGLSPVTMLSMYRAAVAQARLMPGYCAILTVSDYVRREYLRHGFAAPERLVELPLPFRPAPLAPRADVPSGAARLVFAGRMTVLKGGHLMIEALPQVARALGRPLDVTMAGDGPDRPRWERLATRAVAANPRVKVEFTGWLDRERLDSLIARGDLMVVPSVWPEPFGLVGPEAGLRGVPQAAFAVGGVPEWLIEGVNGHLAPGEPPSAAGLAEAIVKCLRDPNEHARLRRGAVEIASRFTIERHLSALLSVLRDAIAPQLRAPEAKRGAARA